MMSYMDPTFLREKVKYLQHEILQVMGDGFQTEQAERVALWIAARDHLAGPSLDDLMGLVDAARACGRQRQVIYNWLEAGRHEFPQPIGRTGSGPLFSGEAVRAWAEQHPELCYRK